MQATLKSLEDKRFQCESCLSQFKYDKNKDERLNKLRIGKSCQKESGHSIMVLPTGHRFKRCPGNFVNEGMLHFVEMHRAYENGVLPFSGSYYEQPNKIMEVISTISQYKFERAIEQSQKERAKNRIGGLTVAR